MTTTANGRGILSLATAYLRSGLSVIPNDRDKVPDSTVLPRVWDEAEKKEKPSWKPFQSRLATADELAKWFGNGVVRGLGVVCGRVSGNLELLDFDWRAGDVFPEWCEQVEAECPDLIARLNVTRTPGKQEPGYHVRYRCREVTIPGNMKLAEEPDPADPKKKKVLIETRGEGGQGAAVGTPVECHESGREFGRMYEHFSGPPLTEVPDITAAQREVLIRWARSFDSMPAEDDTPRPKAKRGFTVGPSAGDDFNDRGPSIPDQIRVAGWELDRGTDDRGKWRRPDQNRKGWAATTVSGKTGKPLFCVFSTNAGPFPGPGGTKACSTHDKFGVYCWLNHGGDFSAAAKALAAEGYGTPRANAGERTERGDGLILGPLALRLGQGRRTASGKLGVPLGVYRDGRKADEVMLTSSSGGRRDAARLLSRHLDKQADRDGIDAVLAEALCRAAEALDAQPARGGPTVASVVSGRVPDALELKYRTAKGLWSEKRGGEATRADVLSFVPEWLIQAAGEAADAPRDASGAVVRSALVPAIQSELAILWATLMERLPPEPDSNLGEDSAAARAFRNAFTRLWTATQTWEVIKGDSPADGVTRRSSLAGRVRHAEATYLTGSARPQQREKWREVQANFAAWWRPYVHPLTGEVCVALAMRWELTAQIRVDLPGVTDQASLASLGKRFGIIDPSPSVTDRLSGGTERLAVLSLSVTEGLLSQPEESDTVSDAEEPEEVQ